MLIKEIKRMDSFYEHVSFAGHTDEQLEELFNKIGEEKKNSQKGKNKNKPQPTCLPFRLPLRYGRRQTHKLKP